MITLLNRLTLCLAVLSQLVLGVGRGMVLCVESDGSMQLEIVSIACCEPEPVHDLHVGQEEQEEACSGENGGCGGCTDQVLKLLELPKSKNTLPPLVAVSHVSTEVRCPSDRIERTLRTVRPTGHRLTCLKSVVLRC
jgi:hypothetical protein